jgi:hypothetical protein
MGGTVRIITKLKNEVLVGNCWTGSLVYLFKNIKFLNEDQKHLDSMMDEDKEKLALAPFDYGLIFIDLVSKRILYSQEFTPLDYFNPISIQGICNDGQHGYIEPIQTLINQKKLSFVPSKNCINPSKFEALVSSQNIQKDMKELMTPFTYQRFDRSLQGFTEFKQEVEKILLLSKNDLSAWDEYIEEEFS